SKHSSWCLKKCCEGRARFLPRRVRLPTSVAAAASPSQSPESLPAHRAGSSDAGGRNGQGVARPALAALGVGDDCRLVGGPPRAAGRGGRAAFIPGPATL